MATRTGGLYAPGLALVFLFASSATVQAVHCGPEGGLSCSDIGGTPSGDDCTLDAVFDCTADTVVDIIGNLTITAGNGSD